LAIHKEPYENYSGYLKDHSAKSSVTRQDVERTIPGTDMTEEELGKRVANQIEFHSDVLDEESQKRARCR